MALKSPNQYSRLDDRSVEDLILRAYLHREIIQQSERFDDENNFTYTIKPDEKYRPDLASYRAYGTVELRWVINRIAGHESELEPLQAGQDLSLPSTAFIRDRVRHYVENPEIES